MPVSPARRIAFDALLRVERDEAFSSELLHGDSPDSRSVRPAGNEERDWALATEIVMGCLRWRGAIDQLIAATSGRPLARIDLEVLIALRMGCYQLRFLERVPAHAAVSESVELVKKARKKSAAGLVNAVLRNLPPKPAEEEARALAHPTWLRERWQANYGGEAAAAILKESLTPPVTYLRLNPRFDAGETVERLAAEGIATESTEISLARRVTAGRVQASQAFSEGRCRIQDLSSQCVVPLLALEPGQTFLDVCAAPGGKTFQAVEERGSSRGLVAADLHLHRLRTLRRLGGHRVNCLVLDAERPLPLRGRFDKILVDAPCSGTGTLARNPEIKWRLEPSDIGRLASLQQEILANALDVLAPGGVLVYSTCSLEPEENQQVVEAVLKRKTSFQAGAYFQRVPGREPGDGFYACQIRWR